jgi:hypothetical protein
MPIPTTGSTCDIFRNGAQRSLCALRYKRDLYDSFCVWIVGGMMKTRNEGGPSSISETECL